MTTPYAARWRSSVLGQAWAHSRRRDLGTYTLALAAQQVLCTAPLLVAISALIRRFGGGGVVEALADYLDLDAQSGHDIVALFATHYRPGLGNLLVGFGVAFLFATGVAVTSQRVFEEIWQLPRAPWQTWWRQVIWALALVPLLSLAVVAAHSTRSLMVSAPLEVAWEAVGFGAAVGVFYGWSQYFLLLGRVRWRQVRPAATLTMIGVGITDLAAQLMVPSQLATEVRDYGLIGATFVLSGWVLVLSSVIVGAAILGFVMDRRSTERSRA